MYYETEAKAGVKKRGCQRQEIVVEEQFADVLRGVLTRWQGEKTLVLAMDASALTDRFTVLSLSVVSSCVCDPSGLDHDRRGARRGMATPLGTDAEPVTRSGAQRVERVCDGRPGVVRGLVVSSDPEQWMAPVPAGEERTDLSGAGRSQLWQSGGASQETWARVERERRME
jgi:hypothetical protein